MYSFFKAKMPPKADGCEDSATWHKNGDESKDCAWVAEWSPRCSVKGADKSLKNRDGQTPLQVADDSVRTLLGGKAPKRKAPDDDESQDSFIDDEEEEADDDDDEEYDDGSDS